jgi:hypothetical protein
MTVISLHARTDITVAGSARGEVVLYPIHANTAQIRTGDLHGWQQTRTPQDIAAVVARAARIAFGYYGRTFPVVNSVSCA